MWQLSRPVSERRRITLWAALVVVAACADRPQPMEPSSSDAERGAVLAGLAGCASCHSAKGGEPLGGGYPLETPFGTFYSTNISMSAAFGIGDWSYGDFVRALREGRSPQGDAYWPVFPYTSFTYLSDEDVGDLWAWARAQPAVDSAPPEHEPTPGLGLFIGGWRLIGFPKEARGPWVDDPAQSDVWNRGAYLATALTHCTQCHTPRSAVTGVPDRSRFLQGSTMPPEKSPNISQGDGGISKWSHEDLDDLLSFGMTPEGDVIGGPMADMVERGTSLLSETDRQALITWLTSGIVTP